MPKKSRAQVIRTPTKRQLTRWERERRIKRAFIIGVAFVVALVVVIPAYGYYKEVIAKGLEPIAKVNDKSFTLDAYARHLSLREYQLDAVTSSFSQQSGNDSNANALIQQLRLQRASLPSTVVTDWVNGEVISLAAPRMGVAVSDADVQQELKRQLLGDPKADEPVDEAKRDADAKEQLKRLGEVTGISTDEYRRLVQIGLLQDRVENQIRDQVLTTTVQARVQAILTSGEEEAKKAYQRLQDGEDFAKVAQEVTVDTQSKEKGGELGWVPKGLLSDEFDKAVFGLSPGQTSEPFSTPEGYYIVKLLERDEARPIEASILDQVKAKAITQWLNEEKGKQKVLYYISSDKQLWAQDKVDRERAQQLKRVQQPR
ncbi:MAG: peptidylprolyl isomerase [Chloroflexi bacterium]|nr:peptidylprolyl isomerase [Chloroflexota bacterium]